MKIIGKDLLTSFKQKHADVRSSIDSWLAEAEISIWEKPADIKQRYGSASILADNNVIFNLKGNKYRLKVKVSYRSKIILIKNIGTHTEYMKW